MKTKSKEWQVRVGHRKSVHDNWS